MDRICDGCSSNADATVYLRDGRLLDLCDRHARQYEATLLGQGAVLVANPPGPLVPKGVPTGAVLERVSQTSLERQYGVSRGKRVRAWLIGIVALAIGRRR